jgi:hypothetical protein
MKEVCVCLSFEDDDLDNQNTTTTTATMTNLLGTKVNLHIDYDNTRVLGR